MMMDPDRFADALEAVEGMLNADFDGRILPFDSAVTRTCTGPERLGPSEGRCETQGPIGTLCPFTALYGPPVRDNPFQPAEN